MNNKLGLFVLTFLMSLPAAYSRSEYVSFDFLDMKEAYEDAFRNKSSLSVKSCNLSALTDSEIEKVFSRSLQKMSAVNKWEKLVSIPGQKFKLFNSNGVPANRSAVAGDFIEIKLPGDPTNRTYWVKVESIKLKKNVNSTRFSFIVRPSHHPKSKKPHITDHFFTNEAINIFSVDISSQKLTAKVHGKYESANTTQTLNIAHGIANTAIVHMGWGLDVPGYGQYGFQKLVWNRLINKITNCGLE